MIMIEKVDICTNKSLYYNKYIYLFNENNYLDIY